MASWFCEMGGEREGGRRREKREADKKEQMMGKGRAQWSDDKRDKLKMWMRSEKKWWVGGCGCGCMIGLTLFFFAWSFYSLLCCLNKQKLFFNLDWSLRRDKDKCIERILSGSVGGTCCCATSFCLWRVWPPACILSLCLPN